ncbi:hypothetical protein CM15mP43_09000 [bacterium]|nr:MAG: hypothetical protein CM15mP43_09000 [bacterium]
MGLIIIYLRLTKFEYKLNKQFLINSNNYSDNLALFFILNLGIFTKCAQYPFTIWLPRAMKVLLQYQP